MSWVAAVAALMIFQDFGASFLQDEGLNLQIPNEIEVCLVRDAPNIFKNDLSINANVGEVSADFFSLVSRESDIHQTRNWLGAAATTKHSIRQGQPQKAAERCNAYRSKGSLQNGGGLSKVSEFDFSFSNLRHSFVIAIEAVQIIDSRLSQEAFEGPRLDDFGINIRSFKNWESAGGISSRYCGDACVEAQDNSPYSQQDCSYGGIELPVQPKWVVALVMALGLLSGGITVATGILKYDVKGRRRLCVAIVALGVCLMFVGGLWPWISGAR